MSLSCQWVKGNIWIADSNIPLSLAPPGTYRHKLIGLAVLQLVPNHRSIPCLCSSAKIKNKKRILGDRTTSFTYWYCQTPHALVQSLNWAKPPKTNTLRANVFLRHYLVYCCQTPHFPAFFSNDSSIAVTFAMGFRRARETSQGFPWIFPFIQFWENVVFPHPWWLWGTTKINTKTWSMLKPSSTSISMIWI